MQDLGINLRNANVTFIQINNVYAMDALNFGANRNKTAIKFQFKLRAIKSGLGVISSFCH